MKTRVTVVGICGLFFGPEDVGGKFLRNMGRLYTDYTALNSRSCGPNPFMIRFSNRNSSVVVKALCYKPEGRGFETR
jgi:hypothetical protein